MAPSKNAKRAATAVVAPSPKKSRTDPKIEGIIATLQNAEYLNEHCRAMLVAMTSGLSTPQTLRHAAQTLGVTMIEETLQEARKKFAAAAAQAQEERSVLESSKETRVARMTAAEASLQEKQAAQATAQSALDAAQEALKAAQGELAKGKEELLEGVKPFAALEKEQKTLTTVIEEHFRAPMADGQGPHFHFLEQFTEHLGLEESLIKALPSSCVKTKEQRGGFDDLVIAEFEKALVKKVSTLEKSIADEAPVAAKRSEVVAAAEASLSCKVADEEAAAKELAALTAVRSEAEAELSSAKDECVTLEPSLEQVVLKHNSLLAELKDFEGGTLANFEGLRDRTIEVEAATAGA